MDKPNKQTEKSGIQNLIPEMEQVSEINMRKIQRKEPPTAHLKLNLDLEREEKDDDDDFDLGRMEVDEEREKVLKLLLQDILFSLFFCLSFLRSVKSPYPNSNDFSHQLFFFVSLLDFEYSSYLFPTLQPLPGSTW